MTTLEFNKMVESITSESTTTIKENMYKILENNNICFDCIYDTYKPFNNTEFSIDYLDRDKLIKVLKSLSGEFEEIQDTIEYWNEKTDDYYTFVFEELELSQEMERDREYWEYMRIENLYW